jgi:hypothetical protein
MEKSGVEELLYCFSEVAQVLQVEDEQDILLLSEMQSIHDNRAPDEWAMYFFELAETFGLSTEVLNPFLSKTE